MSSSPSPSSLDGVPHDGVPHDDGVPLSSLAFEEEERPPRPRRQRRRRRRTTSSSSLVLPLVFYEAQSLFLTSVTSIRRILKALSWLLLLSIYILYLVAHSTSFGAFATHSAVVHVLQLGKTGKGKLGTEESLGLDGVVSFIRRAFVDRAWRDPVCGDGICEAPYEVPGECPADCGKDEHAVHAVVRVASDFRHTRVAEHALRRTARWNLCKRDDLRARAGKVDDLCYYA